MKLLTNSNLQKMANDDSLTLHLGSVILAPRIRRCSHRQHHQKLLKLAPRRVLDAAVHEKRAQIDALVVPRLLIPTLYVRGVHKEPNDQKLSHAGEAGGSQLKEQP